MFDIDCDTYEQAMEKYNHVYNRKAKFEKNSVIRLQKIIMDDFKGVKHGEIDFRFGKHNFTPFTKSDITGIYGQNGSGKTAIVEAIKLLEVAMSAGRLSDMRVRDFGKDDDVESVACALEELYTLYLPFAEWINKDAEYASFTYVLDYIVEDKTLRTIEYSFCLGRKAENTYFSERNYSIPAYYNMEYVGFLYKHAETVPKIFNEKVSIGGLVDGKKTKMQPVIDLSTDEGMSVPASKLSYFIDGLTEIEYSVVKKALEDSKEEGEANLFYYFASSLDNDYARTICRLLHFASSEISVVENDGLNSLASGRKSDEIYPIYTTNYSGLTDTFSEHSYSFSHIDSKVMRKRDIEEFRKFLDGLNPIVSAVIPGVKLSVETEPVEPHQTKDSKQKAKEAVLEETWWDEEEFEDIYGAKEVTFEGDFYVDLYSEHNGNKVPYRCESVGTRRLISEISLFVAAYNRPEMLLVIDEFDAGVFEFLLGELLQIFEESGKGQFVFTSHNLRPLEVLDKKCICFTTTNPENRYVRMKNLGKTNNLRTTYFREILLQEQDEELYKSTKKHNLMAAFKKAGK